MCHQRIFVHEHCDCVWDKYRILCDEHDTPGHTFKDWPIPVDTPCDIHPGGTPFVVTYFLRAAEFEFLEDDDSSTDTSSNLELQSEEVYDSDEERQIHLQQEDRGEEQCRAAYGRLDGNLLPFINDKSYHVQDDTIMPNKAFSTEEPYTSVPPVDKSELSPSFDHHECDGEEVSQLYHLLPLGIDKVWVIKLQHTHSLLPPVDFVLTVLQLGFSINQVYIEEKSIKMQKMDRIYCEASCVRIWPGEAEDSTEAATPLQNSGRALQDEAGATQRIMQDDEAIGVLNKLLLRWYWSRLWVSQEILLASRTEVRSGTFVADWWTVKILDTLTSNPSIWNPIGLRKISIGDLSKASMNIAHFNVPSSQLESIENLLFPNTHLQASRNRDKLHALMDLYNIRDDLAVDYSESLRGTYNDFTRCYTRRTGGLSLLSGAGLCQSTRGRDISLHSWVPDFHWTEFRNSLFLAAEFSKAFDASQLDGNESMCKETHRTFYIGRESHGLSGKPTIQALAEGSVVDSDAKAMQRSTGQHDQGMNSSLLRLLSLLKDVENLYKTGFPERGRELDVAAFLVLVWAGLMQVDEWLLIFGEVVGGSDMGQDHDHEFENILLV
ncbi:ankyrin and HET domain-containing protein [Colletotrichum orchidophilum]|uniref:Ankyrin and HET domain-containing protein n=1 Tax=Colletotrichum orchidophilum TaxID=1209926 RepID=A0A1G4BRS2_9PEZI|nr:ankyrin and HET domain-containing protein [Colletotrichum orchidophilum]OHF04005.1 ankyrin and HET domain-containing protein [Colletotrichum orchidophilum]